MQVSGYQSLMLHMEWADAVTWTSVLGVPSSGQDRPMRERLHHLHSTQSAYLHVLLGRPLEIPELTSFPDLTSVGRWARHVHRELESYRSGLNEAQLRQVVQFPWAEEVAERFGGAEPATVGESLLQVALHTTYHRGQVAARLRESGGEPPLTDFIAWIWMRRPAPPWGSLGVRFDE
jgi:uncharacterized damage-inducible protein DinB